MNQAEAASKPIQHNEIEEVSAQRKCEDHFVATLTEIGQIKPDQIKRRLRVDDTFKQSKRELGIVLILNEKIYVFLVRNWTGNYRPGPDGKFWLKRTEYEESITVEQIRSPLVELQVIITKLSLSVNCHFAGMNTTNICAYICMVQEQVTLMHNHLTKNGASVTKLQVAGKLVFPNGEIVLDDEVRQNDHILAGTEQIMAFARGLQQTWKQYLLAPITPSYFSGALSYSQLAASRSGLGRAGGWDKLKLVGGRVIDGDYKGTNYFLTC